ncbi:MAG TPA: hypothetical protein V6C57_22015 [Coleofasciculaceae cyanobacterium]
MLLCFHHAIVSGRSGDGNGFCNRMSNPEIRLRSLATWAAFAIAGILAT